MGNILGIDIGTTKVAVVVTNRTAENILFSLSYASEADIPMEKDFAEQDVTKIISCIKKIISEIPDTLIKTISSIGVTGQMHGVVLWNKNRISHLYTWKDNRTLKDNSFKEFISHEGCENLKSGYGPITLAWLNKHNLLKKWSFAALIHDYIVYEMCNLDYPVTDPSDAASWGIFDKDAGNWNYKAISSLNLPKNLFPKIQPTGSIAGRLSEKWTKITRIKKGTPVYTAIGDNQASILSISNNYKDEIYLTLGTGAQLSAVVSQDEYKRFQWKEYVEFRPFINNKELAVAAPLCGGAAFAWLIKSVIKWAEELDIRVPSEEYLYKKFDALGIRNQNSPLKITPSFLGERHNPDIRASIHNIDLYNMTPGNMSASLSYAIIENIYDMFPKDFFSFKKVIVGSGNALRKLSVMQKNVKKIFKLPLNISGDKEEAAAGAAKLTTLAGNR